MKFKEAKQYLQDGMKVRKTDNKCCPSFVGIMEIGILGVCCMRSPAQEFQLHCFNNGGELEILNNPDGSPWIKPYQTATEVMMQQMIDARQFTLHPQMYFAPKDYLANWDLAYKQPIKIKKPIMSRLNNMMKRLLDNDTQTLVKAGYINGDLELTAKGREALDSVLFAANKAELVTLAQAELDEERKRPRAALT